MEQDHIPGTLKVFGCPAEELLTGKAIRLPVMK